MGEAFVEGDVARAGERSLWAAVILAAIQDATAPPPPHLLRGGPNKDYSHAYRFWQILRDRDEAIDFLTGDGDWRRARDAVCDAAGIDCGAVRERVAILLDKARLAHGEVWDRLRVSHLSAQQAA